MGSEMCIRDRVSLVEVLVETGLAETPRGEVTIGQAKKLIKSKAVWVNGNKVEDETLILSRRISLHGKFFIIQKGKKSHHLVLLE